MTPIERQIVRSLEELQRSHNGLVGQHNKLATQFAETQMQAQQQKLKDTLIETYSKLYDRAAAYTNLIMLGGYASAFAVWASTRQQLTPKANVAGRSNEAGK